jgi:hypothetical protein
MPGKAWSSRWIDAQVLKHAARTTVAATVPMLKARAYAQHHVIAREA